MALSELTKLSIKLALIAALVIGSLAGFIVSIRLQESQHKKDPDNEDFPWIYISIGVCFGFSWLSLVQLSKILSALLYFIRKRNSIHGTKTWERHFEKLEWEIQRLVEETSTTIRTSEKSTKKRENQRGMLEHYYGNVERYLVDFSSWDFGLEKRNARVKPEEWEEQEWTQAFVTRRDGFAARLEGHLVTRQKALLEQADRVKMLGIGEERIAATKAVWKECESVMKAKMAFYREGWPMVDVNGGDLFERMRGVNLSNGREGAGVVQQRGASLNDERGSELKNWVRPTSVDEIV